MFSLLTIIGGIASIVLFIIFVGTEDISILISLISMIIFTILFWKLSKMEEIIKNNEAEIKKQEERIKKLEEQHKNEIDNTQEYKE